MPAPDVMTAIYTRRSVRHFTDATIDRAVLMECLKAASWAPSGMNNQPWRFAVVWDADLKAKVGALTRYTQTLTGAAALVCVLLDRETMYDYVKDCQACGAALQNLLLAVHAHDLGAVWVGEILKNKEQVVAALGLPPRLELMAVVAVGHPAHRNQESHRKPLEEIVVLEK